MRFSTATVVSLFFLAASAVASPIQGASEVEQLAAREVEEKADGDFGIFGNHHRFGAERDHHKDVHLSEEKVNFSEHENSHRHRFGDESRHGREFYRREDAEKAYYPWGGDGGYDGFAGSHHRFGAERDHHKDVHLTEEKVNFSEHENSHRHRFGDDSRHGREFYRREDAEKAYYPWGGDDGYDGFAGSHHRFGAERDHHKDVHFSEEKVNFSEDENSHRHRFGDHSRHGFF